MPSKVDGPGRTHIHNSHMIISNRNSSSNLRVRYKFLKAMSAISYEDR